MALVRSVKTGWGWAFLAPVVSEKLCAHLAEAWQLQGRRVLEVSLRSQMSCPSRTSARGVETSLKGVLYSLVKKMVMFLNLIHNGGGKDDVLEGVCTWLPAGEATGCQRMGNRS